MEDDKLKDLFAGFNPPMDDDRHFMSQIERSLQAVEMAKNQCAEIKRRNSKAVIVASFVGFVCGVVFTLCYPYMLSVLQGLNDMGAEVAWAISNYGNLMVWIMCSIATCALTFVGYDISLAALSPRR